MEIDAINFEAAMQLAVQKGVVVHSCKAVTEISSSPLRGTSLSDDPTNLTLVIIGEICAGLSLCCCPVVLALAAFILGIVLIVRHQMGWGIALVIQAIVFGAIGIILAVIFELSSLANL